MALGVVRVRLGKDVDAAVATAEFAFDRLQNSRAVADFDDANVFQGFVIELQQRRTGDVVGLECGLVDTQRMVVQPFAHTLQVPMDHFLGHVVLITDYLIKVFMFKELKKGGC